MPACDAHHPVLPTAKEENQPQILEFSFHSGCKYTRILDMNLMTNGPLIAGKLRCRAFPCYLAHQNRPEVETALVPPSTSYINL